MKPKDVIGINEHKANIAMSICSAVLGLLMIAVFALNMANVSGFQFEEKMFPIVRYVLPIFGAILIIPVCFLKTKLMSKKWVKYVLMSLFIIGLAIITFVIPQEGIIFAACLVVSCLYFNPKLTKIVFFSSLVLMVGVAYLACAFGEFQPTTFGDNTVNKYVACTVFHIIPRVFSFVLIGICANLLAKKSNDALNEQIVETRKNEKNASELNISNAIQSAVLPKEFPDSAFGEVYAIMDSAKEVGGDFYDYFEIDDSHIALVIGDASGKGIPSALYMMKAQSLIRGLAKHHNLDTGKIMMDVNSSMCEGNEYNMFVTAWLGILNKDTGELRYTNAGHNPPIIKTNGKHEFLSAKPGLVLGGFPEFEYVETVIKLNKGDRVLLYTDGITEAHNVKSELYGEEHLLEQVAKIDDSPFKTINLIRDDVRHFARNTEQFDDITMLMVEYHKSQSVFSKKFEAKKDNLENVQNFILDSIKGNLAPKDKNAISIVAEEIFINIASYSFEGKGYCTVDVNFDNNVLTIVFTDNGKKFNPLELENPNTREKAENRQIGGLGIFMVKNMMDKVYYEYEDGKNILTMIKNY